MRVTTLADLQVSLKDTSAFGELEHYFTLCHAFLTFIAESQPTRIVSPSQHNYIFYQYSQEYGHKITRPLNMNLFIELADEFKLAFERFITFLADLKGFQETVINGMCQA